MLILVLHLLLMNGVSEYHSKHTKSICTRLIANKIKDNPKYVQKDPIQVLNKSVNDVFKFKELIGKFLSLSLPEN